MNGKLTWAVVDGSLRTFHDGELLVTYVGAKLDCLARDVLDAALRGEGFRIFHDGVLLTILSGGRLARLAQDAVEAALHDAGKRP
jgi:hypothetical protein